MFGGECVRKSALWKDTFREIWKTKTRFLSIFAIILLGVAFFAGISATGPVMVETADEYFDEHDLMDIHVLSTYGLNEDDQSLFDELDDATVDVLYALDVVFDYSGETSKVFGLNEETQSLNRFRVEEGRLPEDPGEIALDLHHGEEYDLGDTVQIEEGTSDEFEENFERTDYEVVGFVYSPLYIENMNRGNTQVGTGTLNGFSVILEEDFNMEYRTEAYIRFDESEDYTAYSAEYETFIDEKIEEIEELFEGQPEVRLTDIREEIEAELEEGRQEIEDARQELEEAEEELTEAREELDEGWRAYEEGLAELESEEAEARAEIAQGREEVEDGQAQLEQARQDLTEAQAEVDAGWAELEAERQSFDVNEMEQELEEGSRQLEQGRQELNSGQAEIDSARQEIEEYRELLSQTGQFEEALGNLNLSDPDLNELEQMMQEFSGELQQLEEMYDTLSPEEQQQYQQQLAQLNTLEDLLAQMDQIEESELSELLETGEREAEAEIQAAEAELDQAQAEVNAGYEELEAREAELVAGEQQLAQGLQQMNAAEAELTQAQAEIDAGWAELEAQEAELIAGEEELDAAEATLDEELSEAQAELDEARVELEEGETEYEEGLAEFEEESADAESELADAEAELEEGESELDELEEPEYMVNDRSHFQGYEDYGENSERIQSIATIFPVFFFLLAALISLTTMTRMVDESRNQIGTMKALGYSNHDISLKFFTYAFIATIVGSVVGFFIGYAVFPRVIMDAYGTMFNIPNPRFHFFWSYALISFVGALLATGLSTLLSVRSLLRLNSASLLRPKAPKKGKRILLERIPFIWNNFTFTQKVASRNLFRYKRRMLMTIFGISGCTALLLTGYGLGDSIADIGDLQFGEINQYQAIVMENEEASEEQVSDYQTTIEEMNEVEDFFSIHQENVTAILEEDSQELNMVVAEEPERMNDFVVLRDHEDENQIYELPDEGVILTEKLSQLYDLEEGDYVTIEDNDNETFEVEVVGIVEHYVRHYAYFSPEAYERARGEEASFNAKMLKYDTSDVDDDELGEQLTDEEAVQGVMFVTMLSDTLDDSMDSLDVVTVVLIVSAAALAIVVLYNLTNINVSERIRELSTIKVLGFFDREVTMYVYRENVVLTLMGIIAGLFLGVLMHSFVLDTAEMDMMMFSRVVNFSSYLYASALTFIFSAIVMVIMHFKLKHVDMIEALKTQD